MKPPPDIQTFFNTLNKNTIDIVDDFYDANVHFQDPVVNFSNRDQVKKYYARLYKNVESIVFEFSDEIKQDKRSVAAWKMTVRMKGKPISVDGVSVIKFGGMEGKAVYHRDYFDMGAFIYEHIPLLGNVIKGIKGKMLS